MDCYKDFAQIYDELIYGDVEYKKWANVILNLCDEFNIERKNYLDLACGTGNLAIEICKEFKYTWAVDLSHEMLTIAESKMRSNGLKAKFICQNISELDLKGKYNLITCCLDSTNYILEEEELKKYFLGVYKVLEDNGLFIFDINSYYKLSEVLGNNVYNYDNDDVVYIWENYFQDEIVDMNLTFFVKEGEKYRRFDEEHQERAYSENFIEKLLGNIGFKVVKKLDNYENKDVNANTERVVYVVIK